MLPLVLGVAGVVKSNISCPVFLLDGHLVNFLD
jgi:hypothetical protein